MCLLQPLWMLIFMVLPPWCNLNGMVLAKANTSLLGCCGVKDNFLRPWQQNTHVTFG
uniref:Uncharacterized protein n=1 Tax=Oryza brachyantha TaxID=4533 RepID=J3L8I8_ORYBR